MAVENAMMTRDAKDSRVYPVFLMLGLEPEGYAVHWENTFQRCLVFSHLTVILEFLTQLPPNFMTTPRITFKTVASKVAHRLNGFLGTKPRQHQEPYSPVPHLLRSNDAPTETETIIVKDFISALHTSVLPIPDDDPAFEANLRQNNSLIQSHTTILSVFRTLPFEIIQKIFRFAQESAWLPLTKRDKTPWTLMHVSRRWRTVALDSPFLWNRINVCFKTSQDKKKNVPAKSLNYIKQCISQSGAGDLHATFYSDIEYSNREDDRAMQILLAPLIAQSMRWATLYLYSRSSIRIMEELLAIKGRIPVLRSVEIKINEAERRAYPFVCDTFENAPMLNRISLSSNPDLHFRFPWRQIRSCNLSSGQKNILDEVITHSSHLTDLAFSTYRISSSSHPLKKVIKPALTHLEINFSSSYYGFFERLAFPNLECLTVTGYEGSIAHYVRGVFLDVQLQAPIRLHTLTLQSSPYFQERITTLLDLLPTLKVFHSGLPHRTDLNNLTIGFRQPSMLPNLEEVVFYAQSVDKVIKSRHNLRKFIRSRWVAPGDDKVKPLRSVCIAFRTQEQSLKGHGPLEEMMSAGGWGKIRSGNQQLSEMLAWSAELLVHFPRVKGRPCEVSIDSGSLLWTNTDEWWQMQKADQFLKKLEKVKIQDVKHLYVRALHTLGSSNNSHPSKSCRVCTSFCTAW